MNRTLADLRRTAREIFHDALTHMDAGEAVRRAVALDGGRLRIFDTEFALDSYPSIYSVAVGKAALPMAAALGEILGDHLAGGVLSALMDDAERLARWQTFAGGHPLPNEASLAAARAAFELLRTADRRGAPIIFLISGGGSAMLEWPRVNATTLAELREANRMLVSCGANIAEINAVRRAFSAVKGGGLSAHAPRAPQATLIVSDTRADEPFNVASGLTMLAPTNAPDAAEVVARYRLDTRLPASILHAVNQSSETNTSKTSASETNTLAADESVQDASPSATSSNTSTRRYYVLLDNEQALERAATAARSRGFAVAIAHDLVEQPVAEGASALVSRLVEMQERESSAMQGVCLVSGGEFACPVRGGGVGGRNTETVLRCAIEMDDRAATSIQGQPSMVALSAGTDGIDGNSPAAGALADHTTLARARARGLVARKFLAESDAYSFFHALGDALITGATGTNVRDLRIMLASKDEVRG
ncbi:MAG TPA: DUF4147 domain-containing protein [Pyrinomonadaceae bacterium]